MQLDALDTGRKRIKYISRPLKTGVTVSVYPFDDGASQAGEERSYTILDSGQYSGFSSCLFDTAIGGIKAASDWLGHPRFIPDPTTSYLLSGSCHPTGSTFIVTGSALNDGTYTVEIGSSSYIQTVEPLVDEPATIMTISRYFDISNECVLDNKTGLMWMRAISAVGGSLGNGALKQYRPENLGNNIFSFAVAANRGHLAGYTDWRVPNMVELFTLTNRGNSLNNDPPAELPTYDGQSVYTSNQGVYIRFSVGSSYGYPNFSSSYSVERKCTLVRTAL